MEAALGNVRSQRRSLPRVSGDGRAFLQCFQNLLSIGLQSRSIVLPLINTGVCHYCLRCMYLIEAAQDSCSGLSVNVILYLVNDSQKNRLEPRSSSMVCRGEIGASNERSKVRGQPDTHGPTTTSTCCLSISGAKSYNAVLN